MTQPELDYAKVLRSIRTNPNLNLEEKNLAFYILSFRDPKTGLCEPQQSHLAKLLQKDRNWVKRRVKKLRREGILISVPDRDPTGKYRVLRYYFFADLDHLRLVPAVVTNRKISDDLLCIDVMMEGQKRPWMKPLPKAASRA